MSLVTGAQASRGFKTIALRCDIEVLSPFRCAGPDSIDVRKCAYPLACPGRNSSLLCQSDDDDGSYCACGYTGPLCSVCDAAFFLSWSGDACTDCDDTEGHAPLIAISSIIIFSALMLPCFLLLKKKIKSTTCYSRAKALKRLGVDKVRILFFTAQTISVFVEISGGTGDGGKYPNPALSVAQVLGMTNLDAIGLGACP